VKGYVPELDENGKPLKSDGKFALTATAFVVAFGAIALRIGGRAALVSTLGLDFITDNPELQTQMNQVLEASDSMDMATKLGLFCLAWTVVKVSCIDAGGVVLALSSGILFGGVIQGAVISAFGATVGSSVAFGLAKVDSPVRTKAVELLDKNPSLRGIEKVVAKDGLKAILTLRLAPILPIPIGFYNYVYGVTNVPYFDFAGGIFLGSLKPYLLDSYLGFFGKSLVDGTASTDGGIQDIILLVALGFSVLIGVFASQLASETWDSVLEEVETEEKLKAEKNATAVAAAEGGEDGITREVFGMALPEVLIGFQLALQDADERMNSMILRELDAKVWNYTDSKGNNPIPRQLNPAFDRGSPEIVGAYQGIQFGPSVCDGLVLSPALFKSFLKYSDPLFDEVKEAQERQKLASILAKSGVGGSMSAANKMIITTDTSKEDLLIRLGELRTTAKQRLEELDKRLEQETR
jgi:uncharacterized membrane protein YdjX (TVP38/TMEM64 family)